MFDACVCLAEMETETGRGKSREHWTESQASSQRRHDMNVIVCLPGGGWNDTPTVLVHGQVGTGSWVALQALDHN